jgi:hypothetical protein
VANATGIGPALRKARILRGKSIEEASRETRIRAEYLQALERERFESLLGEVYVRGFLRSYSSYLGLDSDKVVSIYTDHFGLPPAPAPAATEQRPPSRRAPNGGPRRRRRWRRSRSAGRGRVDMPGGWHLNWAALIAAAVIVVAILATAGWFSRSRTAPEQASGPGVALPADLSPAVTVGLEAKVDVHATITADGEVVFDRVLRAGEGGSWDADHAILVRLDRGASATLTVNGHLVGSPGSSKQPYEATFVPNDFGRKPSPGPSVG